MSNRQGIRFDGQVFRTPGVQFRHGRNLALTDAAGAAVVADAPVYGALHAYTQPVADADRIVTDDTAASPHRMVACGRWIDGQTAYVQLRSTGAYRIAVHVGTTIATNCFKTAPARTFDHFCVVGDALNTGGQKNAQIDLLRNAGAGGGESAAWIQVPRAFAIHDGLLIAQCDARQWTGSVWEGRATALCYWDDAVPDGSNKWKLMLRTPTVQSGKDRGQAWALQRMYVMPDEPNAVYIAYVDYVTNPGSTGGELYIQKCTRTAPGGAWTIGTIVPLFTITGVTDCHFHNAAVVPWGAGLAVVLNAGDTFNAHTVTLRRNDRNILEGYSGATFTAPTPGPDVATATGNGWTVDRTASGNIFTLVDKIDFTGATWATSGNTITNGPNSATTGNLTGRKVVVTGGTGLPTNPTVATVATHSGTTLTLDKNVGITNASADMAGYICRGAFGPQPVGLGVQFSNQSRLIHGTDEGYVGCFFGNIPNFQSGNTKIEYIAANSRTVQTHRLGWNAFGIHTYRNDADGPWVASIFTSSTAVSSWSSTTGPGKVMVGEPNGQHWAAFHAPNVANGNSNYRALSDGTWAHLGAETTNTLVAVKIPAVQVVRPLITACPAVTNHAVATPTNIGGTTVNGPNANSTATVVARSSLATLIPGRVIPEPPTARGPILRVTCRSAWAMIQRITGATVPNNANVKIALEVYPIQPANPANNETDAPFHHNGLTCLFLAGQGNNISAGTDNAEFFARKRTDTSNGFRLDAGGWTEIVWDAGTPTGWAGSNNPGSTAPSGSPGENFALALAMRIQNGALFNAFDCLVAIKYVLSGDVELPTHPLPVAASAGTIPEARSAYTVPRAGSSWTKVLRFAIPPNGLDQYAGNRGTPVAFTLKDSAGSGAITIAMTPSANRVSFTNATWDNTASTLTSASFAVASLVGREIVITGGAGTTANSRVTVTAHTANSSTLTVSGDVNGATGNSSDVSGYVARSITISNGSQTIHVDAPVGFDFCFDRKSNVTLALSYTGTTLSVWASVDGTPIGTASGTFTNVNWDTVQSGDASNTTAEPVLLIEGVSEWDVAHGAAAMTLTAAGAGVKSEIGLRTRERRRNQRWLS